MKNKWVRNVIFVVALAVFLYSAYQLFIIFSEYQKGEKEYDTIVKRLLQKRLWKLRKVRKRKKK